MTRMPLIEYEYRLAHVCPASKEKKNVVYVVNLMLSLLSHSVLWFICIGHIASKVHSNTFWHSGISFIQISKLVRQSSKVSLGSLICPHLILLKYLKNWIKVLPIVWLCHSLDELLAAVYQQTFFLKKMEKVMKHKTYRTIMINDNRKSDNTNWGIFVVVYVIV